MKGLTNLVKGVQLNTNPTQSSQNFTTGTDQPTSYNPNSTPSFRGKGGSLSSNSESFSSQDKSFWEFYFQGSVDL